MAGQNGYTQSNSLIQMWLTVLLSLLQVIPTYRNLAEAHGSAFVQTTASMKGLREIRLDGAIQSQDGMGLPTGQGLQNDKSNGKSHEYNNIKQPGNGGIILEPAMLDFGEQPIGMPKIETVIILNPHPENSIIMLSISGNTPHFHSSFFQDKVVLPGGNTTFDVVFLARVVGNAENSLYIHTNKGLFPYQVFGVGIPNPYRLRPFLGARVPVNTSFSPLINMHNPYSETIQVTEMYSSGGDLHLELPTGEREASQTLWEIPPFQTKSVMRASFVGRVETNHTAFIRIKTNQSSLSDEEEFVILPMEVEVSATPGIYSSLELLDFGTLRSFDDPKILQIYLINTGQKAVHISNVFLLKGNEAISIDFKPQQLRPSEKHVKIADIVYDPSKAVNPRSLSGKIVIKTKEKNYRMQIPYQVHVLQGTLGYNKSSTIFYVGKPPYEEVIRELPLTNLFNFALIVHDVTLPKHVQHLFTVKNFTGPIFIAPHDTDRSLQFSFKTDVSRTVATELKLNTNASLFTIPVHCYNGTLKPVVHSAEVDHINFGTMGIGDVRSMTFTIINENPVEVPLYEWGCNMEGTRVELLGVEPGNGTYLTKEHNISEMDTDPLVLPPYHYAVFRIEVIGPGEEGQFVSEVLLKSPYEVVSVAVIVKTADGCLQARPEEIHFRPTFPGRVVSQPLTLLSSFKHPMTLESIAPETHDDRFYFRTGKKPEVQIELEPLKRNKVGRVFFDAKQTCKEACYVGLPLVNTDGYQWLHSLAVPPDIIEVDIDLYQTFRNHWHEVQQSGRAVSNITLRLDTNLVKSYPIAAEAQLAWPSLTKKEKIQFPLTQIGNDSIEEVKIFNPSDVSLLVQLLPIANYPNPQSMLELLIDREKFDPDGIEVDDLDVFFLKDLKNKSSCGTVIKHSTFIETTYGVKPNTSTVSLILKPRSNITVILGFAPVDETLRTSLILIRNNLTIIDFLLVEGQGARGEFRVSNKKPGANSTLLFELKASHLADCDRSSSKARSPPNFTVKRTFTTKNVGQLPIHIRTFEVNGYECEGYGFKVLNCKPYILKPNQTYKVDIAFTPDFTLSRITRHLKFITEKGPNMEFMLIATVPPHLLPMCSTALPRPPWEHLLYAATICLMITLFMGVIMVSYLEALRFIEPSSLKKKLPTDPGIDKSKRFDLRSIGTNKPSSPDPKHSSIITGLGSTLGFIQRTPSPPQNNHTIMANNTKPPPNETHQLNEKKLPPERERVKQNTWNSNNNKITHLENLATRGSPVHVSARSSPPVAKKQNQPKNNKRRHYIEPELEQNSINDTKLLDKEYELQKHNLVENLASCSNNVEKATEQSQPQHNHSDLDINTLKKMKNKPRKSKATSKREEKERQLKERLVTRKEEISNFDQDDSSSTTTEYSNPELDPIEKLTKQSTHTKSEYDEYVIGGLYSELKTKQKSKLKRDDVLDIDHLKRFKDVKSKSRKGVKVDPKTIFNGDVLRPSTLELPYTTALEAGRRNVKGPTSPHSIAAAVAAKALKKNLKESTSGISTITPPTISESSSDRSSDKDSPPPLWDQPKPVPNSDALQQLSIQTLQANSLLNADYLYKPSQLHPVPITALGPVSPGLSASSRSSSYSSVVSSTSSGESGRKKKKNKLTKNLTTPGKTSSSAFTAVGDKHKHPGAIGTITKSMKASWNISGEMDSSDACSSGSSPNSPGGVPLTPSTDNVFNHVRKQPQPQPQFAPLEEATHFPFGDDLGTSVWASKKREPPSNAAPGAQSEWSGFGVSTAANSSSLWDTTTPSWTTATNATSPLFQGNPLWNTPVQDNNLIPSIWTNDPIWTTSISSSDSSLLDISGTASNTAVPNADVPGTFDPFDSFRSSIWGQHSNGSLWNTASKQDEDRKD